MILSHEPFSLVISEANNKSLSSGSVGQKRGDREKGTVAKKQRDRQRGTKTERQEDRETKIICYNKDSSLFQENLAAVATSTSSPRSHPYSLVARTRLGYLGAAFPFPGIVVKTLASARR